MSTSYVVQLPDSVRPLLEAEAREHGFASVAEYVATLVHANTPTELEDADLERAIEEGSESGAGRVVDESLWEDLRRKATDASSRSDGE